MENEIRVNIEADTDIIGNIHSFESMGSVDGPGIRSVVFFQGCSLRCAFCHNPDTWGTEPNKVITSGDLIKKILRFKPYYDSSGGGVTFSGGEPLLQPEFLLDILKKCKESNIHTALDTSGVGHKGDKKFRPDFKEILKYTDLVLLDVKHTKPEMYKYITCVGMNYFMEFLDILNESDTDVWIRAVIIPGINDNYDYIRELKDFALKINNVRKFELLPYHTLGVNKYKELGIKYRLGKLPPMDKKKTKEWEELLNKSIV